jgi:RimJ/RimL family protein N-acetyltransferase
MIEFEAPKSRDCGEFTIRAYAPEDAEALYTSVAQSLEHLYTFIPWAQKETSLEEYHEVIRLGMARYAENLDFMMGIWMGDQVVGGTGFHLRGRSVESEYAEIGMWIHVDYAGKGLGSRVLRAMLEWGFTEWPWDRIEWRCDTENLASARVAEKNGMVLEGRLRRDHRNKAGQKADMFVFSMLRDEYVRPE